MKRRQRRYSREFKLQAVRQVLEQGASIARTARELGVSRSSVGRWVRELRDEIEPRSRATETATHDPGDDRQLWLARQLDELRRVCGADAGGTGAEPAAPGGIALDAHERALLRDAFGTAEQRSCLSVLQAQGIALRIKIAEDLERLDRGEPLWQELIADAGVGLALVEETQAAIDHLIRHGQMRRAKELSAFRAKVREQIPRLVDRIGKEGLELAQARSAALITALPLDRIAMPEPAQAAPVRKKSGRKRVQPSPQPKPRRAESATLLRPLLIALAASLLIAVVLGLWQPRSAPTTAKSTPLHDRGIQAPEVRSAGLTADLDATLSLPERRQLLQRIDAAAGNRDAKQPPTSADR